MLTKSGLSVGIAAIFLIGFYITGCMASAAEMQHVIILQSGGSTPPVAYLNETVDMAYILPWSNTIAWWSAGHDPETTTPDITITVSGFQHKVWLDPAKYKVGMWYKWDGKWESSGYNEAFEIKSGTRPVPKPTENQTVDNKTIELEKTVKIQNTTSIILARGDSVTYEYGTTDTESYGYGFIWAFGTEKGIFGKPMELSKNDSAYYYTFTADETQSLQAGTYTGYLQFVGNNKWQDVFINPKTGNLDSPYKAVAPVNLSGKNPQLIKSSFDEMRNNTLYCDDIFVPVTIKIEDPIIRFTDYYEQDDNLNIHGLTTLSEGTEISFVIDPERFVSAKELAKRTFTTTVKGDIGSTRTFDISMPVDWSELSVDDHTIVATIAKGGIKVTQNQILPVGLIFVNPVQTPIGKKVIVESYGWHVTNNTNTSYIQYSNGSVIDIPVPTPQVVYVTVTVMVTPTPTPTLPAEPTPVPTPTDDINIPMSPMTVLLALIIVCAYVAYRK